MFQSPILLAVLPARTPAVASGGVSEPGSTPHRARRRVLSQTAAIGAALLTSPVLEAGAWCGGFFPGRISLDVAERLLPFELGSYTTDIYYRIVSPPRRQLRRSDDPLLPPVLVAGAPGVPFDYCENLGALVASGRRVLFVNTCEAPRSVELDGWPPVPPAGARKMRRPAVAAQQLLAVCDAVGEPRYHVFAHGLGGAAALRLSQLLQRRQAAAARNETVAETTARLASLTLASPYGALGDLTPAARNRLREFDSVVPLDVDVRDAEVADGEQCVSDATLLLTPPYREALLEATRAEEREERLGGDALAAKLPPPSVPTMLLSGGAGDAVEGGWDLGARSDVLVRQYPFSGHLPFIDARSEVLLDLLEFLDRADGRQRGPAYLGNSVAPPRATPIPY